MSTEQDLVQHLDQVNKVVEEYLKGNDPTRISKELAIPRQQVVSLINEWKVMASANDAIRARAKEALVAADTHYSKLITKAYEVIEDATTTDLHGVTSRNRRRASSARSHAVAPFSLAPSRASDRRRAEAATARASAAARSAWASRAAPSAFRASILPVWRPRAAVQVSAAALCQAAAEPASAAAFRASVTSAFRRPTRTVWTPARKTRATSARAAQARRLRAGNGITGSSVVAG